MLLWVLAACAVGVARGAAPYNILFLMADQVCMGGRRYEIFSLHFVVITLYLFFFSRSINNNHFQFTIRHETLMNH